MPHAFFSYRRSPFSPALPSESLGLTLVDHADDARQDPESAVYPFKMISKGPLGTYSFLSFYVHPRLMLFQVRQCRVCTLAIRSSAIRLMTTQLLGFSINVLRLRLLLWVSRFRRL